MKDFPRSWRKLPDSDHVRSLKPTKPFGLWSAQPQAVVETSTVTLTSARTAGSTHDAMEARDVRELAERVELLIHNLRALLVDGVHKEGRYVDRGMEPAWRILAEIDVYAAVKTWPGEPGLTERPYRFDGPRRLAPLTISDVESLWAAQQDLLRETFSVVLLVHPQESRPEWVDEYFQVVEDERIPYGYVQLAEEL